MRLSLIHLQLLMWDMCPDKMRIFTQEECKSGEEASQVIFVVVVSFNCKVEALIIR